MGYDVYITHATDFSETLESPIAETEWNALVAADSSLQLSKADCHSRRKRDGSVETFHPVLWTEHPENRPVDVPQGGVHCTSPDERMMVKMVEIAQKLGARVLDEDGGTYTVSPDGKLEFQRDG